MKTAFLETSAINYLHDHVSNAQKTKQLFASNNLIPVVGIDTIYELERCFTSKKPEKAQSLFSFLKELDPVYSCKREELYIQELDKLLSDFPVNALLNDYSKKLLTARIEKLSSGNFNSGHKEFIDGKQLFWKKLKELWRPDKIKNKLSFSFEEYKRHCLQKIEANILILQEYLINLTGKVLSKEKTMFFLKKLNSFPALRAVIYSQFYLNYLVIINAETPSEDKFTDSLQIIGASYCSNLVSHDNYLLTKLANTLNPDIQPINISSLI